MPWRTGGHGSRHFGLFAFPVDAPQRGHARLSGNPTLPPLCHMRFLRPPGIPCTIPSQNSSVACTATPSRHADTRRCDTLFLARETATQSAFNFRGVHGTTRTIHVDSREHLHDCQGTLLRSEIEARGPSRLAEATETAAAAIASKFGGGLWTARFRRTSLQLNGS